MIKNIMKVLKWILNKIILLSTFLCAYLFFVAEQEIDKIHYGVVLLLGVIIILFGDKEDENC